MASKPAETIVALGVELNALLVAFRTVMAASAARFHPTLQPAAYQIALVLSRGPAKTGRMAELLGMDKSAVSRLAKSLCNHGLAAASADPHDGRGILYSLTDEGVAGIEAANVIKTDAYLARLEGWSDDQVVQLTDLLRKFNNG